MSIGRRTRPRNLVVAAAVAAAGLVAAAWLAGPRQTAEIGARLTVAGAMAGDTAGFLRADRPRTFVFPDDHGPHPGYRTEWWYVTGNLEAVDGRRFGYQLTLFRAALAAEAPPRGSAWGASEAYMAHFALTDVEGKKFHAFDRFARAALGLAGAEARPLRVWLEDWSMEGAEPGVFPLSVRAAEGDVAIELHLDEGKPPVLQGDAGLSRKGPEPGNASYYYSLTRMPTRGTVRIGGERFEVRGESWLDREWSTSALGRGQVGWDWFSLRLSDTSEVMYYQIRRDNGTPDPFSAGTVVDPDGATRRLDRDAVRLEVRGHWASPRDGTRYPSRWRLRIPSESLDLEIEPVVADQELNLAFRYWEGAVRIRGTRNGRPIEGEGYVELTGYADAQSSGGAP